MDYTSLGESTPLLLDPHKAYHERDIEASVAFHNLRRSMVPVEQHSEAGDNHGMEFLLSGIQGILVSISTIYAVVSSGLPLITIPVLGLAHLLSDSITFGAGGMLAAMAERDYIHEEMAREKWELEVNQQGEIDEMVDIYEDMGMDRKDAIQVWNIYSKYPKLFLKVMLCMECNILIPKEEESPLMHGLVKALSFSIFSLVPLLPFIISDIVETYYGRSIPADYRYIFSAITSILTLFFLGVARAKRLRTTRTKWLQSAIQILTLGSIAALCSYLVGTICRYFLSPSLVS